MIYKYIIYNEDGVAVSYGETNTPIENISTDLGTVVEVENFDEIMDTVPSDEG